MQQESRRRRGRIVAALAVAALTAVATPQAYAAPTDLGTVDPFTSTPFWGVSTNKNPTVYDYTFTLTGTGGSSIDAVASPIAGPSGTAAFSAFTMNLYSGTTTSGTLIASTNTNVGPVPSLHEYLSVANLTAGTYLLDIQATATGAHHAFAGTISAVPLPAAFPLFGGALLGMAVLSRRRARKNVGVA